jgi:GlpG protein
MRQVGTLPEEHDAKRFAAYLVTLGIDAHAEQDNSQWAVWVRDENSIDKARELFEEFQHDPADDRYLDVERAAEAMRREEAERRIEARKNVIQMTGRWKQPATRRAPLTMTMILLSIVVTIVGSFGNAKKGPGGTVNRELAFLDKADLKRAETPLASVGRGELWRIITPIFIHLDPWHLAFNMIMFFQFGSMVENARGTVRLGLLVLSVAVLSNMAQAVFPSEWGGSPFFGGMSGVVYGLFGYVWMRTLFTPEPGLYLGQITVIVLVGWLFLCMTGVMGPVANVAHVVGLIVGMAVGYVPAMWRT